MGVMDRGVTEKGSGKGGFLENIKTLIFND